MIPRAAELFSGSGVLAKALGACYVPCWAFDSIDGKGGDLAASKTQASVLQAIRLRFWRLAWLGRPCTSLSRARSGAPPMPAPVRSSSCPWGLSTLATKNDALLLKYHNKLISFIFKVIRACLKAKVIFVLENPRSSILWCFPFIQWLTRNNLAWRIEVDFCAFGTPWRKSTTLLSNSPSLRYIECRCGGKGGICGISKQPHQVLNGKDPTGVWWTRRAQAYPKKFAARAAQLLAPLALKP